MLGPGIFFKRNQLCSAFMTTAVTKKILSLISVVKEKNLYTTNAVEKSEEVLCKSQTN